MIRLLSGSSRDRAIAAGDAPVLAPSVDLNVPLSHTVSRSTVGRTCV
jgi:hypothetical protein